MKIIIVLLVAIAGVFWFFHGRGSRVTVPPPLRDAAAEATAQAKAVVSAAESTVAEVTHSREAKPEASALSRIVAGEKLREQAPAAITQVPKPANSAAYDLILRGDRIVENKRAASQ